MSQGGESSYYLSINRGKKSIALDNRTKDGRAVFRRLARTADILVENYRPGVMDRYGSHGHDSRAHRATCRGHDDPDWFAGLGSDMRR